MPKSSRKAAGRVKKSVKRAAALKILVFLNESGQNFLINGQKFLYFWPFFLYFWSKISIKVLKI